jgi:hypothetical protein
VRDRRSLVGSRVVSRGMPYENTHIGAPREHIQHSYGITSRVAASLNWLLGGLGC